MTNKCFEWIIVQTVLTTTHTNIDPITGATKPTICLNPTTANRRGNGASPPRQHIKTTPISPKNVSFFHCSRKQCYFSSGESDSPFFNLPTAHINNLPWLDTCNASATNVRARSKIARSVVFAMRIYIPFLDSSPISQANRYP